MNFAVALQRVRVVFAVLLVTTAVVAADAAPAGGVELRRGVVVDTSSAYVARPEGGIAAVDLASGRSVWSSDAAAVPLAMVGPLLIAQAEDLPPVRRLRIVVFDTAARGRKVIESSIALPEDVYAIVDDEASRSFRVKAEPESNGVRISWTFTETEMEGATDGMAPSVRTVTGAAHLDVTTGRALPVTPRRVTVDAMAETLMSSNALKQLPVRSGDVLATTEGGRGGPLFLKRWDAQTGAPLPERELLKKAIVALASADRAHVVGAERVGAGGPDDPEYRWSIFAVESGELAGEVRRDVSASPFVVSGSNLVFETPAHGFRRGEVWFEEPLKIRAVRLSTGVPLWDQEIRDMRYRGDVPPGRSKAPPEKKSQSPARRKQ
jgi:hypothetical protein